MGRVSADLAGATPIPAPSPLQGEGGRPFDLMAAACRTGQVRQGQRFALPRRGGPQARPWPTRPARRRLGMRLRGWWGPP